MEKEQEAQLLGVLRSLANSQVELLAYLVSDVRARARETRFSTGDISRLEHALRQADNARQQLQKLLDADSWTK